MTAHAVEVRRRLAAVAVLALLGALELSACADEETLPKPKTASRGSRTTGHRGKKPSTETAGQHIGATSADAAAMVCNGGLALCGGTGTECVNLSSDPKNCGACGHDCQGGGCEGSSCQPIALASGQGNINDDIVVDGTNVYWTTSGASGKVMRVPIGGGQSITLAAGQVYPTGIAVDRTSVYWTTGGAGGKLVKVPIDGGQPTILASGPLAHAISIAVDSTSVYGTIFEGGKVVKVPIGGGLPIILASGQGFSRLVLHGTSVFWTSITSNSGNSMVLNVPIDGGQPNTIVSGRDHVGIAVDGASVYWTTGGMEGKVMKVPIGGGQPITLAAGDSDANPIDIAVDGTSVYWTDRSAAMVPDPDGHLASARDAGKVMKMPLGGGQPVTLASGQNYPSSIAVDGTSVYWTSSDNGGTVWKVAK